ncbi:MAG: IreB family regulatory phosphoprotein [Bacilli bacterium]
MKDIKIYQNEQPISTKTINDSIFNLKKRGYNLINQMVGYLINYENLYNQLTKFDKNSNLNILVKDYITKTCVI